MSFKWIQTNAPSMDAQADMNVSSNTQYFNTPNHLNVMDGSLGTLPTNSKTSDVTATKEWDEVDLDLGSMILNECSTHELPQAEIPLHINDPNILRGPTSSSTEWIEQINSCFNSMTLDDRNNVYRMKTQEMNSSLDELKSKMGSLTFDKQNHFLQKLTQAFFPSSDNSPNYSNVPNGSSGILPTNTQTSNVPSSFECNEEIMTQINMMSADVKQFILFLLTQAIFPPSNNAPNQLYDPSSSGSLPMNSEMQTSNLTATMSQMDLNDNRQM